MISMLRAIRFDRAMSPIEVIKVNGKGYTHTLYRGCHRLAASIAVGYPLVPTVIIDSVLGVSAPRSRSGT